MKVDILDLDGKKIKNITLPEQFSEEIREDIIKKAGLAIQSHNRQPYGSNPEAGKRHSAMLSKRRRKYRGVYGPGRSRTPRKVMTKRGSQFYYVGAVAPFTRGGRRAHPPKAGRIWDEKINKKERKKAIRSALAATSIIELVNKRGHKTESAPLIVESKFENVGKTKEVRDILNKIGLEKEMERISVKKVRAGKGKGRGRRYKTKKGPLIVTSKKCKLFEGASNIKGIDVVQVKKLNVELLAPGTILGRLVIYTDKAIEVMGKENLFYNKK